MEPAIEQFFTGRRNWKFYDEIIKIVRPGEENPRPGATTISYFATNLEDLYKGLFYNVKKLLLVIIDVTTCRILSVVTMLLPVNDFDQIKPRISLEMCHCLRHLNDELLAIRLSCVSVTSLIVTIPMLDKARCSYLINLQQTIWSGNVFCHLNSI